MSWGIILNTLHFTLYCSWVERPQEACRCPPSPCLGHVSANTAIQGPYIKPKSLVLRMPNPALHLGQHIPFNWKLPQMALQHLVDPGSLWPVRCHQEETSRRGREWNVFCLTWGHERLRASEGPCIDAHKGQWGSSALVKRFTTTGPKQSHIWPTMCGCRHHLPGWGPPCDSRYAAAFACPRR